MIIIFKKIINRLRPSLYLKRFNSYLDNEFFDVVNGTDTALGIRKKALFDGCSFTDVEYMNDYVATYTSRIKAAINKLIEIDSSVKGHFFYDLGCGKGKVLVLAERAGFKNIFGVEISPDLITICKKNLKITKSENISVLESDAAKINISNERCVFYIYNSFERPLLNKVLANIYASYEMKKREMYIIYIDPRSLSDNTAIELDDRKFSLLHNDRNVVNPFHIYKLI